MKRILIKAFTTTNLGDDLFVRVLCERYPKHHFYINCSKSDDSAFENIPNLTIMNRAHLKGMLIHNLKKIMGKLGLDINFPYDAQVYIGGSIFIEFRDSKNSHYYFKNLYDSKISTNLPYFILGANFGPYYTTDFIQQHKEYFLKQVDDLCMRDRSSYELFKDLKHVRYAPDILCTYHLPMIPKKNFVLISCIYNDGREEIRQFDNDAYEKKMVSLCEFYLSLGKQVCLLSMCDFQKDYVMCRKIKKHFNENVNVVEYNGNIEEVTQLFASAEYVIASRFHAMVLGWLAKTPVFPIAYSDKTLNVIKDYGFKGNYTMIEDFSDLSLEQIDYNRANNYIFNIDKLQTEAQDQFLKLDEFLQK